LKNLQIYEQYTNSVKTFLETKMSALNHSGSNRHISFKLFSKLKKYFS